MLKAFPDAKFIHMVRDSRDVLLSQKNKWKRRFLGASKIPLKEAIRSYMNYHPITSAKFWKSAVEHGGKMENHPRVLQVKFEDVLMHSEKEIKTICEFLGLEFEEKIMAVPNIGSSTEEDKEGELKIDQSKISKWKKGGLNNAEIFLAQLMNLIIQKADALFKSLPENIRMLVFWNRIKISLSVFRFLFSRLPSLGRQIE